MPQLYGADCILGGQKLDLFVTNCLMGQLGRYVNLLFFSNSPFSLFLLVLKQPMR